MVSRVVVPRQLFHCHPFCNRHLLFLYFITQGTNYFYYCCVGEACIRGRLLISHLSTHLAIRHETLHQSLYKQSLCFSGYFQYPPDTSNNLCLHHHHMAELQIQNARQISLGVLSSFSPLFMTMVVHIN